eukprot:TCONS_00061536-protein
MFQTDVKWVLFCPIQLIICAIGIPCNIISAMVWSRLKKKGRSKNKSACNNFILLSIVDIGVLIFSVVSDVVPVMNKKLMNNAAKWFGKLYVYFIHPMHYYLLFTSIFLVTVLSIERLKFVIRPLSSLTFSKNWARALWMLVFAVSFVVNIPSFFEFEMVTINGTTIVRPLSYENNVAFRDIVFISHCIFGLALPWLVSLVCNILLVTKSFNRLKTVSKNSVNADTVHILKTTTALTFSSLLLLSIQCISRCFKMFTMYSEESWALVNKISDIGHLAIPCNSAVNFIMFCLPGSFFRKEMLTMFKRRKDQINVRFTSKSPVKKICSEEGNSMEK